MATNLQVVRQLTTARQARMPLEYDRALQALQNCTRIDEAKYWDTKADALAAWAKIYQNDRASALAAQLKLYAYRRMGELAEQIRPNTGNGKPGARSVLIDNGLSMNQASAARCLALMDAKKFDKILSEPAAPVTVAQKQSDRRPLWKRFARASAMMNTMMAELTVQEIAVGIRACGDRALVDARERIGLLRRKLEKLEELLNG